MMLAAALGCVAGAVVSLCFRLFAGRTAMQELRRKLWAHVLELRLFGEEPVLAFASLLGIVKINLLLLARALPPLLIAAPVVALIVLPLNEYFTRTPLGEGESAVMTVRLHPFVVPQLQTPSWIHVDAPPVSVPADGEVSWRLRATAPSRGLCRISVGSESVTKQIDSRPGFHYSGHVRSRGWLDWLERPAENRLPAGPIDRIWIAPAPSIDDWKEWFAIAASFTAWLLPLILRVRFRR